ncbi:MAG: hypothetical protein K6E24_01730 [bacterium]|nr:hypothetical protein [bacterium]
MSILFIITCCFFDNSVKCEKGTNQENVKNKTYEKKSIIYDNNTQNEKGIDSQISINDIVFTTRGLAFYKVSDYSCYNDYYVSFCDSLSSDELDLIGAILIPKNTPHAFYCSDISGENNILEFIYEYNDNLHISFVSVQDDVFLKIDEEAVLISDINSNNELSVSILDVLNYERHYLLKQLNAETIKINDNDLSLMAGEQLRNGYCNDAETVSYQEFDDYTSHKGGLNSFLYNQDARDSHKYYMHNYGNQYPATDNIIVNVIPKQLFGNVGIYSYIGTEYGFFIKTVQSSPYYTSDFIVFTIKHRKQINAINASGMFEIKVAFKGYADYNSTLDLVSDVYSGSKLALANIDVNLSVCNETELNIGDSGYSSSQDYGYYLNGYNITYNGRKPNLEFDGKYFRYAASFLEYIPKVGTFLKWVATDTINAYENYYNTNLQTIPEAFQGVNDTYSISKNWLNNTSGPQGMIQVYGNLIKGIDSRIVSQNSLSNDGVPLLFDYNDLDKVLIDYSFVHDQNHTPFDALFECNITLEIYEDNTNHILGTPNGSVDYQDGVNGAWAEQFNCERESSTTTIYADTIVEAEYNANGFQKYSFTPTVSGWYDIETFGTRHDTVLSLYLGQTLLKVDNNSGRFVFDTYNFLSEEAIPNDFSYYNQLSSLMHYNLTANTTYTIQVKGANNIPGYTYLIVKKYGGDLVDLSTPTNYTSFSGHSKWYTITPPLTDIFDIMTFGTNGAVDTYVELYNRNHERIMFSDGYDNTDYGKVYAYLEEDETYFVHVWHSDSGVYERQFGIAFIKEEEINSTIISSTTYETYDKIEMGTYNYVMYRFKPSYSDSYKFYTEYAFGEKDLVMYLYDSNFNQLSYNDDGNGNRQPLITYQCYSSQTYYIYIKHYYTSDNYWTWFYFMVEEA